MVASTAMNMLGTNLGSSSPLVSLKVSENVPNGETFDYCVQQVIDAINYAEEIGIKILNYSSGFYSNNGVSAYTIDSLKNAIENLSGIFVCSAGNENINLDTYQYGLYPAEFDSDNILVVGASTSSDTVCNFSDYGSAVDLFAPGASVKVVTMNNSYAYDSGTSFSSPHVAGVAGLVLSAYPNITTAQLKSILCNSSDKLTAFDGKCSSGGRLNAFEAVVSVPHYHACTSGQCIILSNGTHMYACDYCEKAFHSSVTYTKISVVGGHRVYCNNCNYSGTEAHSWLEKAGFFVCGRCGLRAERIPVTLTNALNTLLLNVGVSPMSVDNGFTLKLTSDIALIKYEGQFYLIIEEGKLDSLNLFVKRMNLL